MGSPITLSGFNQIDFNQILSAIMQQERQPVVALEAEQRALEAQKTAFGTLASRLASLESAAEALSSADAFRATSVSVSKTTALTVSAGATAAPGSYEVYVDQLARAKAVTSQATYADVDTTMVAGAGTLTFETAGGTTSVTLEGDVTLGQLVNAINEQADAPASASVVRTTDGRYQLMLTGKTTGEANAFALDASAFTAPSDGGAVMTFAEVQGARDAQVRLNGVTATSTTNSFEGVIAGLSFSVLQADVANPVMVTITASSDSVENLIQKVAAAFNDATSFIGQQTSAAARQDSTSIGRDTLVRGLRSRLSRVLTDSYAVGGTYMTLAEVGFEFSRTGQLTFNASKFREALSEHRGDVEKLFLGSDGTGGAFGTLVTAIEEYTKAGGLVPNAQNRLTTQLTKLSDRVADMEERLAIRRAALQQEFIAADRTLSQLNAQQGSLGSLGSQYRLF